MRGHITRPCGWSWTPVPRSIPDKDVRSEFTKLDMKGDRLPIINNPLPLQCKPVSDGVTTTNANSLPTPTSEATNQQSRDKSRDSDRQKNFTSYVDIR